MSIRHSAARMAALAFATASLFGAGQAAAQMSLTTLGSPHTQNFDTLPASGSATWTNNSNVPGWFHARTGTGTTVVANNGSSNAGNLYSFGTGTATDRALGSLGSGNAAIGNLFWGVRLQNNTGATIASLDVSFVGEQWRNSLAAAQTVAFSYVVGSPTVTGSLAEFQSPGTAVATLDFTSPITGGAMATALDGNLAANRVAVSGTITGLSIPNGTEVMLRWSDPDHTGADHGLSIDDFSVVPQGGLFTVADLAITNVDLTDPVTAGNSLSYTVTVSNNGPDPAANVSWTETLPAGTTFASLSALGGWSCTTPAVGAGGTITCTNAVLPVGSAAFTLQVGIDAGVASGTVLSSTATASSSTSDPNGGNESATATTTVATSADLSVTASDSPDPVTAGDNFTYTLTATNAGPSNAASVSVDDTLPAGTTFVSLSAPGGWSCTTPAIGASGTVNCTNPSFAAGNAVFTLVANVNASVAAGTVLSNTATVASTTTDPNAGNESATAATTVAVSADVSVGMDDSIDPVVAGTQFDYEIDVTNAGPSDASTVSLSDTLQVGTTFVSLSAPGWSCTTPAVGASGPVDCSRATLPVGISSLTLTVAVDAATPAATVLSNSVSVTTGSSDPDTGNQQDTETTTVAGSADLAIAVSESPDPVTAGENITYQIGVTQNGPSATSASTNFGTVADFVSLTAPAGWSCTTPAVGASGPVTCSIGSLAAGSTSDFTLVDRVPPSIPAFNGIVRPFSVTAGSTDPNPANNSASATFDVVNAADFAVTKTGPAAVAPGDTLSYTITLTNNGPSDGQAITLTDAVPANTTFESLTVPAGWNSTTPAVGGTGNVTITNTTNLVPGGSGTFTLVVRADAGAANGTVITNTATVTSSITDPDGGNNSATATTTVQVDTADLSVTKTGAPDPVLAGGNLTYTIAVSSAGPASAANVSLSDTLPANTTFVSFTAPAGWTPTTPAIGGTGTVTATNPTLESGANAVFTLVVQVDAGTAGGTTITNTASIASDTADPDGGNDSATDTATVQGLAADLSVTKSDAPDPVTVGSNLTYTIVVNNAGPNAANNVSLADSVPANTTFVSFTAPAGWTATTPAVGGTGAITATNPSLAASTGGTFTLVVNVNAGVVAGTTITNTATVTSATTDPAPANNSATATTTTSAAPAANVTGTKSAAGSFEPSSTVTYTIVLTNGGSGAQADNAGDEFTDVLPSSLQLVSATANSGTAVANVGTRTVTWNGAIPAGGSVTIVIAATIPGNTAAGTTINNTGTIATDTDGNGSNETTVATDDPSTGAGGDATGFVVSGGGLPVPSAIMIPGLDETGKLLLAVLLMLIAAGSLGAHRRR